jgi:zinc protease
MLTKGTDTHTEAQLVNILEQNAITLSGSADMDTFTVSANCLTEHTDMALELMAEVVSEPSFVQDEFDKLKTQVVTNLKISSQQPRTLLRNEFGKRIYGDHPYARTVTGLTEDVEALAPADLKDWHSQFVRPQDATIILAGDITEQKAVALVTKYFGNWTAAKDKPQITLPDVPAAQPTRIYIVDRPGSMQSEIRVGQPGITRHIPRDYYISRVVSNYFGWSFNSRLNETIRIKKGLTYGVWGTYSAKNLAGEFWVSTFTKNETTAETVQTVIDEINRLTEEPPNDKELDDSKTYFAGSFVRQRETPQSVAGDLWLIESQNLGDDYLDNLLKTIAVTSKDDCINLAKKTIDTNKLVVVVVGDAEKVKDELMKIAPITIVKPE